MLRAIAVSTYSSAHFFAGKRRGFVVVNAAETHRAAVADIRIDAANAEHGLKLPVRNKGSVQQNTAVVELLIFCEKETQRVRAGEHDFHTRKPRTRQRTAPPPR